MQKLHPEHTFEVLHVGQRIKVLEKDFAQAKEALEKAELLIFSYPVYTFIAPCQLHRFIELMKASGMSFEGKYATQISTSKHFYDITAHQYIQDNCQDMKMKYIRGLSADMDDLLTEKGQQEAKAFFDYVCWSVTQDKYESIPASQLPAKHVPVTVPEQISEETAAEVTAAEKDKPGDVVIVTDCEPDN